MATIDDLRRIATSLPGAIATDDPLTYAVLVKGKEKGFTWSWKERLDPKKARVPNLDVVAIRVRSLSEKEIILSSDDRKFFTEPHYNGFPAVLVRLEEIEPGELQDLVTEAWRCFASPDLISKLDNNLND